MVSSVVDEDDDGLSTTHTRARARPPARARILRQPSRHFSRSMLTRESRKERSGNGGIYGGNRALHFHSCEALREPTSRVRRVLKSLRPSTLSYSGKRATVLAASRAVSPSVFMVLSSLSSLPSSLRLPRSRDALAPSRVSHRIRADVHNDATRACELASRDAVLPFFLRAFDFLSKIARLSGRNPRAER